MTASHSWSFSRIGGFDQVLLTGADDLLNLDQLDPKLWAALACPTTGLHFDHKTLQLIDTDSDGRVRLPEVQEAVRWSSRVLRDPALLLQPADSLPLSALDTDSEEGAALHNAARHLLDLLGKSGEDSVTLADVTQQQEVLAAARFNGDGIIPPAAAEDDATRAVIELLMASVPPAVDASGESGVDEAGIAAFYEAVQTRVDWLSRAESAWLPDGVDGSAVAVSLNAVRAKIDDYFSRCRASQYDTRATEPLNRTAEDWASLSRDTLSADFAEIADFPLALVRPEAELPLSGGLNPAWEDRIQALNAAVIKPVLGELTHLEYGQWQELKARFDDYQRWLDDEAGHAVASLTIDRLRELLTDGSREQLNELLAQDLAVKPQVDAFTQVETLLRYRQHLKTLLNNFLNLTDFYSQDRRAIFEAGTLYLDGRACKLCIEVHDPAKHAALAGLSKCFLAYCDCTRRDGATKTIVAAFTGGSQDYLLVGRNGVFYDREGQDWDATITKLVENPIGIAQAFFSPYKRLIRFVEEQAAKSAAAAETASQTSMESRTTEVMASRDATVKTAAAKPKFDLSIIAAMGVAVGGIATALGMLLQAFFGLGWLMPVGMLALLVLISGPSVFIAWLKLRQRNLGPILDASGWAVNGRVKINTSFGSKLTQVAKLPKGSHRSLRDPYRPRTWPKVVAVLVLGAVLAAGVWYWLDRSASPVVEPESVLEAVEE